MTEFQSEQIKRIIREEKHRGTKARLPDEEALNERKTILVDMHELLKCGDRKEFRRILIEDYELPVGSERLARALRVWDEDHHKKKP